MSILVGSDPEVFLKDGDGNLISAIGVLKGTKHRPQPTHHGFVHRDNVLAEVNVHPAETADEFVANIRGVLHDLQTIIDSRGLVYAIESSHEMPNDQLLHWEAEKFGCEPDFDAWEIEESIGGLAQIAGNLRTAGGHVHLGFNNGADPLSVAKACDVTLGLWSLQYDNDTRRRKLYGQAGKHRVKPYGVEYRTLSNFWLRDDQLIRDVFSKAVLAAECSEQILAVVESLGENTKYEIKRVINSGDVNLGMELHDAIMGNVV